MIWIEKKMLVKEYAVYLIVWVFWFSNAYIYIENLSHNLQLSNQQLEQTKERATKAYLDLEASQKQLVISDKMITLGTMVAGVAHEINTPLGAIKANSENILDSLKGLVQKINPSFSSITIEDLQNVIGFWKNTLGHCTWILNQERPDSP